MNEHNVIYKCYARKYISFANINLIQQNVYNFHDTKYSVMRSAWNRYYRKKHRCKSRTAEITLQSANLNAVLPSQ